MTSIHEIGQIRQGFIPRRRKFDQFITIGVGQAVSRPDPAANNAMSGDLTTVIELNSNTQSRTPLASTQA